MNEPTQPQDDPFEPTTPRARFDPPPSEAGPGGAPGKRGGGCATPLLIGCGAALILVGILVVVFLVNADRFLSWGFGIFKQAVVQQLPDDLPAADRERLLDAFDAVSAAALEEELDQAELMRAQRQIQQIVGRGEQEATVEEIRELTRALEAAAGMPAPEEPPAEEVPEPVPPSE